MKGNRKQQNLKNRKTEKKRMKLKAGNLKNQ